MTLGKGVPSNKRNTPKGVSILVAFIVFFATFAMILSNNSLSLYHFQYVLVPKDTDKLRKKRWAVMLIGGARVYAFTHESFLGNVVNQTDPPMDVFSSTSFGNASLLSALSSELMNMESTDWRFDEQYNISASDQGGRTKDRFLREQMEVLQMIDDHAERQNITYDYIFYARPDTYYAVPFNISKLEALFEEEKSKGNRTIFVPSCCDFSGWCDRLAAAPYDDFARMIRVTEEWISTGGLEGGAYEVAFRNRAQFANLTRIDMQRPDDYSFYTARYGHAAMKCAGVDDTGIGWTDTICNWGLPLDLDMSISKCKFINMTTHYGSEGRG